MRTLPDDRYAQSKSFFRVLGPGLIVIGIILSAIGIISFFSTFISFTSENHAPGDTKFPTLFLLTFPGFLLLGIGGFMTQAGYLKEITKYAAKETTSAATITTTAIRAAITDNDIPCPLCSEPIEPDAKFCSHCGVETAEKQCTKCNSPLDPNDRFCNQCGHQNKL